MLYIMERPVMKAPENKGGEFTKQLVSEGLVDAKCYGVMDLGTTEQEFNGEKKMVRKLQISFETQQMGKFIDKDTKEEIEAPLCVWLTKTFSFYEASKLYPLIKDWVDVEETKKNVFSLVGKTAKLMISHTTSKGGKVFADVLKIKPGEKDWKLITPEVYFSLDNFNQDEFDKLPTWMQEQIKTTFEWKKIQDDKNNDLPFN